MSVCVITGTITGLDEQPISDATVRARVMSTESDQSGQIGDSGGIVSDDIVAFTDVNGQFSISVSQNAVIELEIAAINLLKTITVPEESGPVDFVSLI